MNSDWTFDGLKTRLGRFRFLILLVGLIFGMPYVGFSMGDLKSEWQDQKIAALKMRLNGFYEELDQKIRQINYLSVELDVEQSASVQTRQELVQLRQEIHELRKELNFYQKVLAPELVADGITIEQFSIEASHIKNRYQFRFALVQTDNQKRYAKGHVKLNLIGLENGQKRSYDLASLSELKSNDLKFNFHYFQYFEGEFTLANDFIPEDIEIKVVQPKTKWQKYKAFTQKFSWPDLGH